MKSFILAFFLCCMTGVSIGHDHALNEQAGDIESRRTAISVERDKLELIFLTEDAACYKKFAVNNCLEKVNIRRRTAMSELRRQEVLLNDQERKIKSDKQIRKADEQSSTERLQGKASRRTASTEEYQSRLAREKEKEQSKPTLLAEERAAREAHAAKLLASQKKLHARAERHTEAAEKSKKFKLRQSQAQERQAQQEAGQASHGKSSARPLPLP